MLHGDVIVAFFTVTGIAIGAAMGCLGNHPLMETMALAVLGGIMGLISSGVVENLK